MSNVIRVPGVPMQDNQQQLQQQQQQPPYTLLSMETALLIATAAGREVDVNVWFKTNVNRGLMTVREFDSKLKGLATAMGIDQEEDVKRELELAVSQIALRMVHVICGAGNDQDGQPLVDLNYFFKLCQEKVDKYLNEINETEGGDWESDKIASDQNFRNWAEGEYDIATGQLITPAARPQQAADMQSLGEDSNAIKLSVEEYIQDSKQKAEGERPKSAPSGKRAASRGESTEEVLLSNNDQVSKSATSPRLNIAMSPLRDTNNMIVETTLTPASPYDEAVEFRDLHDYYDDHHLEEHMVAANTASPMLSPPMPPQQGKNYWDEQNRTFLMASDNNNTAANNGNNTTQPTTQQQQQPTSAPSKARGEVSTQQSRIAALARPRSSSAPRSGHATANNNNSNNNLSRTERYLDQLKHLEIGPLRSSDHTIVVNERGRSLSRGRGSDAATGGVRRSRSETRASRVSLPQHPSSGAMLPLTPEQMVLLKKDVEALVCDTVRQADLYHLIQVNLGFIDNYTMIPPRGAIVKSEKKEWFSKRDIQVAFLAARLTFNETQLFAWRCLVDDFAQQYPTLYGQNASDTLATPQPDTPKNNTNNAHDTPAVATPLPATALGHPKHPDYLRADWVKKYLVHLRLAKRLTMSNPSLRHSSETVAQSQQPQDTTATVPSAPEHTGDNNNNNNNNNKEVPMMWSEWLGKKLQREMSRTPLPQELQKALQGEKHHLSTASINALLMPKSGITILSEEELNQEIDLRIESWVLDCDGRRDFQHALNVNIRKWIKDHLLSPSASSPGTVNVPVDEAAYWRLWEKLPDVERAEHRDVLLQKTVNEYRDKLYTGESVHRTLSKALYWTYDKFLSDSGGRRETFRDWLHKIHFKKSRDRLDHFKEEEAQRQAKVARLHKRRKAIAPLSVLLQNLEDVKRKTGIPLTAAQRREEMKAIVALKKLARTNQQLYMQLYHKPLLKNHSKSLLGKENQNRNGHDGDDYEDDPDFLDHNPTPKPSSSRDTPQHTSPTPKPAAAAAAGGNTTQEVEDDQHLHIVTKEEFDTHVRSVFAAYLPQNDSLLEATAAAAATGTQDTKTQPPVSIASNKVTAQKLALFRKTWQEKINAVFSGDIHATIQQAMDEYTAKRNAQGKQFQKWLTEKRQADLKKEHEKQEAALRQEQMQEMKKTQGEKAYKKWLRLRRRHKYKSMVDKKAHFVPEARVVAHRERWLSLDFHSFPGSRHSSQGALDDAETHRDTASSSGTQPRHDDNDDDHHEPPRSLRHTAERVGGGGVSHRYATHHNETHHDTLPFDERPLPTHRHNHTQKKVTIRDTHDDTGNNKTTRHTTKTPLGQGGVKQGSAAVSKKTKTASSDDTKTQQKKKASPATQSQTTSKLTRRVATPSQRLSSTSQATVSKTKR